MAGIMPLNDRVESQKVTEEDVTIKSKFENGSIQVRNRYSRSRKTFDITFSPLTVAEFNGLQLEYDQQGQVGIMVYTDLHTGNTYQVRFNKPLEYTVNGKGINIIDVSTQLREV